MIIQEVMHVVNYGHTGAHMFNLHCLSTGAIFKFQKKERKKKTRTNHHLPRRGAEVDEDPIARQVHTVERADEGTAGGNLVELCVCVGGKVMIEGKHEQRDIRTFKLSNNVTIVFCAVPIKFRNKY